MNEIQEKSELPVEITDNDMIACQYLLLGRNQYEIAKDYGISQATVSRIIDKYRCDERLQKKMNFIWNKKTSQEARKKALAVIEGIEPDNVPAQSKAMSAGILIDKARLLDGETVVSDAQANIQINVINYHND